MRQRWLGLKVGAFPDSVGCNAKNGLGFMTVAEGGRIVLSLNVKSSNEKTKNP
jgi:hypothetical protein